MAEIKRTFSASKMNKDIDERLVPKAEYRDALNIEVNTSEGDDVGTVQSILGNSIVTTRVPSIGTGVTENSQCVGSISDTKNDKIYWFVAGPTGGVTTDNVTIWKDYILEYDIQNEVSKYVFVDIWKVRTLSPATSSASDGFAYAPEMSNVENFNNIGIRLGMKIKSSPLPNANDNYEVTDIQFDSGNNRWKILHGSPLYTSGFAVPGTNQAVTYESERILNFQPAYGSIPARYITGINILDGMLFWTDNATEPKKINIERSIKGTGGDNYLKGVTNAAVTGGFANAVTTSTDHTFNGDNAHFHTRLVTSKDGVNLVTATNRLKQKAIWIKEENITVLRKPPHTPPYLQMSSTESQRVHPTTGAPSVVSSLLTTPPNNTFGRTNATTGVTTLMETGNIGTISFDVPVDFRVGDVIMVTNDLTLNIDSFTQSEVKIRITSIPSGTQPQTGVYGFMILGISPNLGEGFQNFQVRLQKRKSLFEMKFVRFAYRYKYKDGEYSAISPWSELAFLPNNYDYAPKQGYNLGMVNQVRSLRITDYVVEDSAKGHDVIEIDILFKKEESPNIYTVKTIKQTDPHPVWPDSFTYSSARGSLEIESELIHALLDKDQLIRPWDNVPIKAKAQDITANRLVYGNYVQNYDITDGATQITPDIEVSLESSLGDLAQAVETNNSISTLFPVPSKSVKSMRTYQVGVVYRDKLGRETPVLAGDPINSTIEIDKEEAFKYNKLTARLSSERPDWAESWKFFVKETSSEYYSLAMDRWYEARDGNVWLSFPSAERNKVDEDTFLILKKQHTTSVPVRESARYKVIAIENEAPEYIKRNTKIIATIQNDNTSGSLISATSAGFPFVDFSQFRVSTALFLSEMFSTESATGGTQMDAEVRDAMHNGFLFVKFTSNTVDSSYYKISNVVTQTPTVSEIKIDGTFGEDMRAFCPTQVVGGIVAGITVTFATKIPENKAEFDGRFFVKILGDLTLSENVLAFAGTGVDQWRVAGAMSSYYIHYEKMDDGVAPVAGRTHDGVNPTNTAQGNVTELINSKGNGANATYHFLPKDRTQSQVQSYNDSGVGGIFGGDKDDRKEALSQWWIAFGPGWFIDSAVTANEDADTVEYISDKNDWPNVGDIANGTHGIFDLTAGMPGFNTQGFVGAGKGLSLSFSGIGLTGSNRDNNYDGTNPRWDVGGTVNTDENDTMSFLRSTGTQFRFSEDPDGTVYTIRDISILQDRHNYDAKQNTGLNYSGANDAYRDGANHRLTLKLIVETTDPDTGNQVGIGQIGQRYNPTDATNSNGNWTAASSSSPVRIEFVEPFSPDEEMPSTVNSAVWETEPKENVELDIYYEATPAYPVSIDFKTNEQYAKYGSIVRNETTPFTSTGVVLNAWSDLRAAISSSQSWNDNDVISFEAPDGGITRLRADGTDSGQSILFKNTPHEQTVTLPYSNCYSFQNGVESNRIRDDYNAVFIRNGVKASAVLAKHYEQERRGAGLIHSGIYNSTSGINETNQFIQGNPITKDLNPRHGSIQKLFNRGNDIAVITEDKCFKVVSDKDMLFNADGSSQLISKKKVLGAAVPYAGDFGTTNPESFAQDNFRSYFVDRTRGKVCRLSMDGVTPISSAGMHDWFSDNLQIKDGVVLKTIVGTYDTRKSLYNVTINRQIYPTLGSPSFLRYDDPYTLSYSETAKGWVSFKSYHAESGLSINNEYYTFKEGELWKQYTNQRRNNFYGVQYDSSVTTVLNDNPGSIKSFNTINYEGSQAKITQHKLTSNTTDAAGNNVSQADGEYYNLNSKTGWYVDSFITNEQTGTVPEFKEKEGKWFNYIRGEATTHVNDTESLAVTSSNLDQQEFSVQGIGVPNAVDVTSISSDVHKFQVQNNTSTSYDPDTERDGNTDGAADGIWDSTAD